VHIDGLDLETHRREIQRRLGYLPESLPVYPEMTIADYLDYAASLKGLAGPDARRAIRRSIEATELGARLLDPIGNLSRGFRQRVGVAQAILGEPALLILDEPGNGLDPQQNEHMRAADSRARRIRHGNPVHAHHAGGGCALRPRAGAGQRPPRPGREHGGAARQPPVAATRRRGGRLSANLLGQLPQIAAIEALGAPHGQQQFALTLHDGTDADTAAGNISRAVMDSGARLYALEREQRDLEQIFREAVQAAGGRHAA
jgi:ABC-2 type transport system ATP-binding protein